METTRHDFLFKSYAALNRTFSRMYHSRINKQNISKIIGILNKFLGNSLSTLKDLG